MRDFWVILRVRAISALLTPFLQLTICKLFVLNILLIKYSKH